MSKRQQKKFQFQRFGLLTQTFKKKKKGKKKKGKKKKGKKKKKRKKTAIKTAAFLLFLNCFAVSPEEDRFNHKDRHQDNIIR